MPSKLWVVVLALTSLSALAQVSFEDKVKKVEFIENLHQDLPLVNLDVYRRELVYEQANLSLDERAKRETNLIAERVKTQMNTLYQNLLKEKGDPSLAADEVRAQIDRDLELVAPEFREEIKTLALSSLEAAQRGDLFSSNVELDTIEQEMRKGSETRSEYLNTGMGDATYSASPGFKAIDPTAIEPTAQNDSDKLEYKSSRQLVASLVSERDSTRWANTSNQSIHSTKASSYGGSVSYRLKVSFAGVELDAGPAINFNRTYSTTAQVLAEGLGPVLFQDGNFDFIKRNQAGKPIIKNGKPVTRFIAFWCDADLTFESIYTGSGGFKVAGMGADGYINRRFTDDVTYESRRVLVPKFINNKTATLSALSTICHNDFMNARIQNNLTVKQSLNLMMRNVIAGLVFSNPKTKCAIDSHCRQWYQREVVPVIGRGAVARCVEETREKYMTCAAFGVVGTKCPIYRNGRKISDGMFEYPCDRGLVCKQTKEYGWFHNIDLIPFQYAEGHCARK